PQHCIHTTIPSTSLSGWLPPDCRPWPGIVQSLFARVGPESGLLSLFLRLAKRSHPCCPCPFTTRASQVRARHTRYYSSPASLPLPFTGHDLHHPSWRGRPSSSALQLLLQLPLPPELSFHP
ncbi:hypothetical protein COCVIDRAFT_97559, partial [Bipolaris victoriae FI3]